MRVLHVVTLITPDGAFGGPARVAVNHVQELRRRGQDAVVVAAAYGYSTDPPDHLEDVPVRLFPARRVAPLGFSGLVAPGMLRWVRRELPSVDAVHIHLARDLITLPTAEMARRTGVPYVVQPHGMIDSSNRALARILDSVATRRVLRDAHAVLYLTQLERDKLRTVAGPRPRLEELINGTPKVPYSPMPSTQEVLFLSRLHLRKRPLTFVEMAVRLLAKGVDARFSIVGPDEGELPAVLRAISRGATNGRVRYEGSLGLEEAGRRIEKCTVFVLPSIDEPFPMAVLEAMARGRPVVVTESCGLAPTIKDCDCGRVAKHSTESLVRVVGELLADKTLVAATGHRARSAVLRKFGMSRVIERWLELVAEPRPVTQG